MENSCSPSCVWHRRRKKNNKQNSRSLRTFAKLLTVSSFAIVIKCIKWIKYANGERLSRSLSPLTHWILWWKILHFHLLLGAVSILKIYLRWCSTRPQAAKNSNSRRLKDIDDDGATFCTFSSFDNTSSKRVHAYPQFIRKSCTKQIAIIFFKLFTQLLSLSLFRFCST